MNYYETLGVSKDASQEEIKKTYRNLARQLHPDRNPGDDEAANKFKEIQQAYEILGDEDKRSQYDNPNQGFQFGGNLFNDFVSNVFRHQRREVQVEVNNKVEVAIDFWEVIKGCEKTLTVAKFRTCEICSGSGASEFETCQYCAGQGVISQRQGYVTMQTTCPSCGGAGKSVKTGCDSCKNKGLIKDNATVKVKIPAWIHSGNVLRVKGQGHTHLQHTGDLYVVVIVNQHEILKRHGWDLVYNLPITYSQAVLGATIMVPTLDGETELTIPKNTKNQSAIIIKGKGFKKDDDSYGDLIAWVSVEIIDGDDEYKKLVESLAEWENKNITPAMKNFNEKCKYNHE